MNRLYMLVIITLFFSTSIWAQQYRGGALMKDNAFTQKGDTLYSDMGLKVYVGQKLTIGNPAGDDGQFRSIISRKAAIAPSIFGQDMRYEYAIENYLDSKKNKEKLKKELTPGTTLTIKKIGYSKSAKPHFYYVLLASDTDRFFCDINLALILKELLF